MDPEEIIKRVSDLRLSTEARARTVTLTATETARGEDRAAKLIMGKIFAERQVNRENLKAQLPRILRIRGSFEVEIVGHNLFTLSLDLESDRSRVLTEGPWHFFQDLMLFKKVSSMQTATNIEFDEITMWVQCHNVPLVCMDPLIIRRVGEKIGQVLEVDTDGGDSCVGRFARVKVCRSLHEPLVRCVPISMEGVDQEVLILILYEKLPESFCFACGKIGHHMRSCAADMRVKADPPFGNWLRAGRGIDYRRPRDLSRNSARPSAAAPRSGENMQMTYSDSRAPCGEDVVPASHSTPVAMPSPNITNIPDQMEISPESVDGQKQLMTLEVIEEVSDVVLPTTLVDGGDRGKSVVTEEESQPSRKAISRKWRREARVGRVIKPDISQQVGGKRDSHTLERDDLVEPSLKQRRVTDGLIAGTASCISLSAETAEQSRRPL